MFSFCVIHVHFCDNQGRYQTLLPALLRQSGHHTGVNIAETLVEALSTYGITPTRIGYFVSNNASNNDKCIEAVAQQLSFDFKELLLHCAGHITNLTASAILWGVDKSSIEPEDEFNISYEENTALLIELQRRRQKGPVSKLYNIIIWVTRSLLKRERFYAKQIELKPGEHELIRDNSTRWNSAYHSFRGAIEQRSAIDLRLSIK